MPTKKTARRTTKATARKAGATRTLSPSHKKALAQGRTNASIVDHYLAAINAPKKRGRKVAIPVMERRLADAQNRVKAATGVEKLFAAQAIRDLEAKLARARATNPTDVKALESAFVKVAKTFGENRGISYGAWRESGVPTEVLKRAGIARTRG